MSLPRNGRSEPNPPSRRLQQGALDPLPTAGPCASSAALRPCTERCHEQAVGLESHAAADGSSLPSDSSSPPARGAGSRRPGAAHAAHPRSRGARSAEALLCCVRAESPLCASHQWGLSSPARGQLHPCTAQPGLDGHGQPRPAARVRLLGHSPGAGTGLRSQGAACSGRAGPGPAPACWGRVPGERDRAAGTVGAQPPHAQGLPPQGPGLPQLHTRLGRHC